MQQIKEIINRQNYQQLNQSEREQKKRGINTQQRFNDFNSNITEKTEKAARAAEIWLKLTEIYGILFVNSFSETPLASWIEAFSKLSDKDIEQALLKCLQSEDKYPPTLNIFINMAIHKRKNRAHKIFKPLPRLPSDKNIFRAEIKKMREKLS